MPEFPIREENFHEGGPVANEPRRIWDGLP
ncbi:hypothetical protein MESS4_120216 [Mesorhizobium sp. STM 4661]|nr:hypothetical protein MESS4_120216 [Mesorhizobium sp. STM 4661]